MTRTQLEHILRAAAAITGADSFVVIGSQSVLGQFPDAPAELLISEEVDVYSLRSPVDTNLIEGSIGEASPFHQTFGYYAHGVGEETAILPEGWKTRLLPVRNSGTGGATGLCLEVHDLAVSKLAAGRDKDLDYVRALLKHGLARQEVISQRVATLAPPIRERCVQRLSRLSIG